MDKHLRMRYKARDYGSRDSGLSLFFFARRATRSGEESGFPEFGATCVPSYRTSAARDPRGTTTSAPGRRGAHEVHAARCGGAMGSRRRRAAGWLVLSRAPLSAIRRSRLFLAD